MTEEQSQIILAAMGVLLQRYGAQHVSFDELNVQRSVTIAATSTGFHLDLISAAQSSLVEANAQDRLS